MLRYQREKEPPYAQRARWSILPRDFEYHFLDAPEDDRYDDGNRATVHAIDWNLPRVSGYVIGLERSFIHSIVPYRSGKLPPSLLDAYDNDSSIWLYFPIDPDERISELWLRSGVFPYDDDTGTQAESLIVITNNGRSLILGPDIRSRSPLSDHLFNYEALADLSSTAPTRTLYYKITPCRGWVTCVENAIFGLLFTYADGRQRSVGQIRLDHLEDPVNVTSGRFWLGISDWDTDPHHEEPCSLEGHVTWLGICEPMLKSDTEYLEIPLRGKLEWRSTWNTVSTESLVRYVEESELQSEMDKVLARKAVSGKTASKTVKTFYVRTGDMCTIYEEE
ncbi:hypothetical protein LZL87_013135 [Fusarium oxysporum]|nr:hypothetical protein LZL87_013135 [Fusarium oxysporum]